MRARRVASPRISAVLLGDRGGEMLSKLPVTAELKEDSDGRVKDPSYTWPERLMNFQFEGG